MSAKFDSESLLDSILDLMTNGNALNNKIAAIEAEKASINKSLTPGLAAIPATGYYEQTWSNKILQTSPGIFYGIEDVQSTSIPTATAKTYIVFVEIVLTDSGQTNDVNRRIARYSRALEELFNEAFMGAGYTKFVVEQVRPISFKLEVDTDDEIKIGGVSIKLSLI
jgi:hypothetical protein